MKIAFDSQIFIEQEFGGVSRYACELATHLDTLPDTRARVFAPLHRNAYLQHAPARVRGATLKLPFVRRTTRFVKAGAGLLSAGSLRRYDPDIFHHTYYDVRVGPRTRAKDVLTVYDMIHERFAHMFPNEPALSAAKKSAVESSDHVVCISRQTQIDLIELFGVKPEKTSVVYLGFEATAAPSVDRDAWRRHTAGRPYILYVGSRGGYKNFARLAQAYGASAQLQANYALLCFGGGGFSGTELEAMRQAGIQADKVLQVGGGDSLLNALYAGAAVFVYPSLYEGFGIPPLEAMAQGCPVVSGNSGSIPEVVSDAALQCDAMEVDALRAAVEQVVSTPALAAQLRERGHARCRQFSWATCAAQTRTIYESLM